MVAYGKFAGLPREHFVSAWKKVDLPTLARPTYEKVSDCRKGCADNALPSCTYDPTLEIIAGPAEE